ncbi:hypothetical protein Ciccas_005882 [Cichlidogyrus casuarinus]|uniref:Uncharacterized protein n=1 Tax=Cichlidogyrus casuarinus TaxID=1844966 RepID=A0ABD2Q7D6_9PLAT
MHVHLHKWRELYCFHHKPQSTAHHLMLLTGWMNACFEHTTIVILGLRQARSLLDGTLMKKDVPLETFAREWMRALNKAMHTGDCFALFLLAQRIIVQLEAEAYASQLEQDKEFITLILDTINKSDGTYGHKMMHEIFKAYSMLRQKGNRNHSTNVYLAVVCLVVFGALYLIPFVTHVHSATYRSEIC